MEIYQRVCEQAVREAGRVLLEESVCVKLRKKGPADLVTQADLAAEAAVRNIVLSAFSDHCLLGEENGQVGEGKDYRWIVDPLDGTTNYAHGVPHYCVSLALERRGELLVGAVFDPLLNECFTAALGQGARLNGRPIRPSSITELSEALAAVGFPPNVQPESPDLRLFLAMLPCCQAIRRTGSSALNMCYLAAGRFDLYWSYSTHIWDIAAAALILRESGGCITAPDGGPFRLEQAHFLAAANPLLHAQLVAKAKEIE